MYKAIHFSILVFFLTSVIISQEKTTVLGLQVKPIIPNGIIGASKQELIPSTVEFTVHAVSGYTFGMVIRKGITELLSIETGINYARRNFDLTMEDAENSFFGKSRFRMVNYEIPVHLLVYVKLGDRLFMNASGGGSIDIYPSDLFTSGAYFNNQVVKRRAFQPSLATNIGWEYRTDDSGYFYVGASYHLPFNYIAESYAFYGQYGKKEEAIFELSGDYLTVDFRYFLPAEKKKKGNK